MVGFTTAEVQYGPGCNPSYGKWYGVLSLNYLDFQFFPTH